MKPPIGEASTESGHPKPARRRKRRKSIFVQKKRRSSAVDLAAGSGEVGPAQSTFLHAPGTHVCSRQGRSRRATPSARKLRLSGSPAPQRLKAVSLLGHVGWQRAATGTMVGTAGWVSGPPLGVCTGPAEWEKASLNSVPSLLPRRVRKRMRMAWTRTLGVRRPALSSAMTRRTPLRPRSHLRGPGGPSP